MGMGRPRILVTTWRRPLPTYLGERTILDTLDPAYAEGQNPYRRVLSVYSADQPGVHDIVRLVRHVTDAYGDIPLVGELYVPIDHLVTNYGAEGDGSPHALGA